MKTNKKLHTTKDPRGFSQKARQREFCSELADFLLNTSCKKEFTIKTIMEMTTGNYQIIFTHLAQMILGEPKEAHKERRLWFYKVVFRLFRTSLND